MSESIVYCDRCGRMIQAREMKSGKVIVTPSASICPSCVQEMTPEERKSAQKSFRRTPTPEPGGKRPSRRATPRPGSKRISERRQAQEEPAEGGSSPKVLLAVASAAAVTLTIVAVALLMKDGVPPKAMPVMPGAPPTVQVPVPVVQQATPATASPTAADTTPSEPATGSAAERLTKIRQMIEPSLGRYDDIRREVKALLAEADSQPVAADAKTLMAEVDAKYSKMADEAYWAATERAYALVSMSKFDQATAAVTSVRSRFGQSGWSEVRGDERIEAILKKIEQRRAEIGDEAIDRAKAAMLDEEFAKAHRELRNRDVWPDTQRSRATKLFADLKERETKWRAKKEREDTWATFLSRVKSAGKEGAAAVTKLVDDERSRLLKLDLSDRLSSLERSIREAKLVQSLIEDGLLNARSVVRLKVGDRPLSGNVQKIENGVLTLKPSVGKAQEVSMAELDPVELMNASGLARLGSVKPESIAAFFLVRGEIEAARETIVDLATAEADKLRGEIEEFATALKTADALASESLSSAQTDDAADPEGADAAEGAEPEAGGEAIASSLKEDFSRGKSSLKDWTVGRGWDVVSGALQSLKDGDSFVITGMPPGNTVAMEVTVTPTDVKTKDGWRLAGPVLYQDDNNYWGLSLVENGENGDRFIELKEMFDGKWESEIGENTRLSVLTPGNLEWQYGKEYRMKLEMTPKGIKGTITESGGDTATIHYAFDNKAVTQGKPALRSFGFVTKFDSFVADVETTTSLVEAEKKALELPTGPDEPLPGETGMPGQWAPGLLAEFFVGRDYKNRVAVRIDPQGVDHYFGNGAFPSLKTTQPPFKVRWTGWLLMPHKGPYMFSCDVNGEMELELDGATVIDRGKTASSELQLDAGLHRIKAVYHCDASWWRHINLMWMPPESKKAVIPSSMYYHEVPALGEYGPPSEFVSGMLTQVFADESFGRKVWEGITDGPEFDLGDEPIAPTLPKDHFSVRFTGFMNVMNDEEYTFRASTNDNVRVKVDGKTLIDFWKSRDQTALTTGAKLKPGLREITIEYMHASGRANLGVFWHNSGWCGKNPTNRFGGCYTKAQPMPIVDRRGQAPALTGRYFDAPTPGKGAYVNSVAPRVDFDWGGAAPAPKIPAKSFSGMWQGNLLVPVSGMYHFRVWRTGGVRLIIGGKPAINKWSDVEAWEDGEMPLRAGKTSIQIQFFNKDGDAWLRAYWSGPKFTMKLLGPGDLAHSGSPTLAKDLKLRPTLVAGAPGPIATGGAVQGDTERPPEGNLIVNGGFELVKADEKFPDRWTAHNWGTGGRFSVRTDKTNSHGGEVSLVARNMTGDAMPGAFTSVRLPIGKYEVRFYASADIGEKARVHAHVGGQDFGPVTVGEEWELQKFAFTITEKITNASVRIWTSTPRVRVWFDDVELENVQ